MYLTSMRLLLIFALLSAVAHGAITKVATSATGSATNTTGATLLVVGCISGTGVTSASPSETFTSTGAAYYGMNVYYSYGSSIGGSAQTFTCTGGVVIGVIAYAGTSTTSSVFDKRGICTALGFCTASASQAVGNETAFTIGYDSNNDCDTQTAPSPFISISSNSANCSGSGYYISTNSSTISAAWDMGTDASSNGAIVALFEPPGGVAATAPTCSTNCAGTYASPVTATFANPNSGTTLLCATKDGTTPTTSAGTSCTNGTSLGAGATGTLLISNTATVKVVAGVAGDTDSSVLSVAYIITLTITTTSLPGGTVSSAYSQTLAATGGVLAYTWSINGGGTLASQGAACAGLSLSSGGAITGTPTTSGTCSFTAKVTDSASTTATQPLSIVVSGGVVATPTCSPGTGTYGSSQSVSCTVAGGATGCYTTSGTAPTAPTAGTCGSGSTTYSTAITISATATNLQILATEASYTNSGVSSYTYTLQVANPVPVYNAGGTTSFSTTTSGAAMYYNNTGGTPACPSTGTLYSGAISPSGTNAIQIIGCLTNYTASSVVTVQPDIPVASDNFQSYYNSALAPGIFPNSSISESGTTVTATSSVYPYNYSIYNPVSIFNSSISGYNGVWTPTAVSSTTYQFTATSGIGNCSSNCGSSFSPAWASSVYTGLAQIGPLYQLPIDCAWTNCAWTMVPNSNAGVLATQPDGEIGGSAVELIPWGPTSTSNPNIFVIRTGEGYYINQAFGVYLHTSSGTTGASLGVGVRCNTTGTLCYTLSAAPTTGTSQIYLDKWVSGVRNNLGYTTTASWTDGAYLELRAEGSCVFRPLLNGLPITGLSATYTDIGCSTTGTLQPAIVTCSPGTSSLVTGSMYNASGYNIGGTSSGYTPPSVPSPTTISNAFNTSTASLPYQPWITAHGANSVDTNAGWGLLTSAPIGATYALGGYTAQMEIRGIFNPNQWQLTQWATGSTFGQFDANFLILRHRIEQPGVANGGCLANSNTAQCADYVGYYIGVEPLNGDTAITSRSSACAVKLEYDCTPFIHITKITPVVSEANNNVITVVGSSYSIYAGDQTLAEYLNGYLNVYCEASATAPSNWTALTSYAIGNVILDSNGNYELATTNGTTLTSHPTWPTTWNSTTNYGNTVSDGTETWMYYGNRCPTSSKFTRIIHLADSDLLTGFGVPGLFEDNFNSSAGPNPVFQNWSASSLFTSAGGYPCATAGNCVGNGGGLVTSGVF